MKKEELVKVLQDVPDDTEVYVTLLEENTFRNVITAKSFDVSSYKSSSGAFEVIGCIEDKVAESEVPYDVNKLEWQSYGGELLEEDKEEYGNYDEGDEGVSCCSCDCNLTTDLGEVVRSFFQSDLKEHLVDALPDEYMAPTLRDFKEKYHVNCFILPAYAKQAIRKWGATVKDGSKETKNYLGDFEGTPVFTSERIPDDKVAVQVFVSSKQV